MRTKVSASCSVRVAMALVVLGAGLAAQQPPSQPPQGTMARPQAGMAEKCKAMMAQRENMMAELKKADERLDSLVAKMNAASGQEKTDAIAAVVSEMVSQRKSMRERMVAMQERMMAHMGEHMQSGPGSMAECPAMKMKMKMD